MDEIGEILGLRARRQETGEKNRELLRKKMSSGSWAGIPAAYLYRLKPAAVKLWLIMQDLGAGESGNATRTKADQAKLSALMGFRSGDSREIKNLLAYMKKEKMLDSTRGRQKANVYLLAWPAGVKNPKIVSEVKKSYKSYKR